MQPQPADKPTKDRSQLKEMVGYARERKTVKFGSRLKPLLTEEVPKFVLGRQSPVNRESPHIRLRKPSTSTTSQLQISLVENRKSEPKRVAMATTKRPSLMQSTSPREDFQSLSKKLQERYFTSKSRAEIHSPYGKHRNAMQNGHAKVRFRQVHKSESKIRQQPHIEEERKNLKLLLIKNRSSQEPVADSQSQLNGSVEETHKPSKEHHQQQEQAEQLPILDQLTSSSELQPQKNQHNLTEKELESFGDRFPQKFQKVKLLGKGGFSLVWLGVHRKSRKPFAIKQILTRNNHQTHLKEIWFGNFFFEFGGTVREEFEQHPGVNHLLKLFAYDIKPDDTWLFYQLCQSTLGCALYSLRPQVIEGQKRYKINYKGLYKQYIADPLKLQQLIVEMCQALVLLGEHNIVHSDIKTENILLLEENGKLGYKLIDYGSSFLFTNLKQFSMATPEYMAPEILNFILYQNEMEYDRDGLKIINDYRNESAIDMWSMGCILLQIVHGVPLWLSYRTEVTTTKGTFSQHTGLFAVKDRNFQKIIEKQTAVIRRLDRILDEECISGITITPQLKHIIKGMLRLEANQRLRPRDVLSLLRQPNSFRRVYYKE